MSDERELAEWLRDQRLIECEHTTNRSWLICCSPCLRDRILTSDWLAEHDAKVEARVREEIAQEASAAVAREHLRMVDHIERARGEAWQEGFDAGENMAHLWGHVDSWEDPPENPYREGGADDE